jgi:transporter family-2 protein
LELLKMRYLILVLVVIGGAMIPVQVAANKRMDAAVKSPLLAATISLAVGAVALGLLSLTGWLGKGHLADAATAPWWTWAAMAMSLFTVVSMIALQRVGAAAVIAATVLGQLLMAALLDHFGWLGVPQVRLNWWRIGGAVILFAGTLMMQRK